ncbi:hypothetical protein OPQ81_000048 [Rhizoctonia solani]|nr:hypothetical protein OPQ81_000048 [Rhizoctonia solani]
MMSAASIPVPPMLMRSAEDAPVGKNAQSSPGQSVVVNQPVDSASMKISPGAQASDGAADHIRGGDCGIMAACAAVSSCVIA